MNLLDRARHEIRDRIDLPLPDLRRRFRAAQFPLRAPTTPRGVEPVPGSRRTGADYDTEWARTFPARFARVVLLESVIRPTMAVVARPRREGADLLTDLVDAGGPVIFVANHHSHVDTPLILSSLPEPWRHQTFVGAAADYFFRTRVTGAAAALALNAVPIERNTVSRRTAQQAIDLIGEGWSMLIFPEGGRSPDGWGQDFRSGAAFLARQAGVPIVPIHLAGTGRILRKGSKLPQPGPTSVRFGDPVVARDGEDTKTLAARIESAVAALADEHVTDWYGARVRAHAGDSPALSGPETQSWRRLWALGDRSPARRRKASWPEL